MAKRTSCDSLWKIWYSILIFGAYIYLFYNAVNRYNAFRKFALRDLWHHGPMNFYLSMMTLSLALLPIFVYSTLFKTGNYANDGIAIGKRDEERRLFEMQEDSVVERKQSCRFSLFRRHFLPYACIIHIISAYLLLIPIPVMAANQIYHKIYPKNIMWHTDLDFVLNQFSNNLSSIEEPGKTLPITPEFANFVFALLILIASYPSTFWQASQAYALNFSFLIFFANIHLLLDFCGMSILYKVALNSNTMDRNLSLSISPITVLVLSLLGNVLVLISNMVVFEYGYMQYLYNWRLEHQYSNKEKCDSKGMQRSCSEKYLSQAVGVMILLAIIGCKIPIMWNYVTLYQLYNNFFLFGCVLFTIVYLTVWTLFWFMTCIKTKWHFKMLNEYGVASEQSVHDNEAMDHSPRSSIRKNSLKKSNSQQQMSNFVYVHSALANIPTISENVDGANSECSYGSHCSRASSASNSRNIIRPVKEQEGYESDSNGLLKYAVRHSSSNSVLMNKQESHSTDSLQRDTISRKNSNRVTFKEYHEMIPGAHNTSISSDSGIGSTQIGLAKLVHPPVPDYSSDYAMFGNLFDDHHYYNQADFVTYADMYKPQATAITQSMTTPEPDYMHVPDILRSKLNNQRQQQQLHLNPYQQHQRQQQLNSGFELQELDPKFCSQV